MKRVLEIALVAAVLCIGAFLFREWRERRELAARPPLSPGLAPGRDVEGSRIPPDHGVAWVPRAKLTGAPKRRTRPAAVPPPVAAP